MSGFLPVLHASDDWVVVAKPPRLAAHPSEMVKDRHTVVDVGRRQFGRKIFLPHRLDRAVSGCLLIAFSPERAASLHDALRADDATKEYLAFVRGRWRWDEQVRVVDKPMADLDGTVKEARTRVTHLASSQDPRCGLLLAEPETGRFHQVRRHVRDLDHPILRDPVHGDGRENRVWKETWGLARLGLHCARLAVTVDGARIDVVCPIAADLAAVLTRMPWWDAVRDAHPALAAEPIVLRSPNPV